MSRVPALRDAACRLGNAFQFRKVSGDHIQKFVTKDVTIAPAHGCCAPCCKLGGIQPQFTLLYCEAQLAKDSPCL